MCDVPWACFEDKDNGWDLGCLVEYHYGSG